jgi:hypothetical protein
MPNFMKMDEKYFPYFNFLGNYVHSVPFQKMAGVLLFLSFLFQNPLFSQAQQPKSGSSVQEVWPEVDGFYKFNNSLRLMAAATGTRSMTSYADGALALNLDYFTLPGLRKPQEGTDLDSTRGYFQWLRVGFKYKRPDPTSANPAPEYSIRTESNTRFHPGWNSMLTVKNRFDFQDKIGFWTTVYRPRITWEKDFRTTYLYFTAYTYAQYFAYFNDASKNNFSIAVGAQIKISHLIIFETYYLYQFQNEPKVGAVNAIGLRLRFYLPLKK